MLQVVPIGKCLLETNMYLERILNLETQHTKTSHLNLTFYGEIKKTKLNSENLHCSIDTGCKLKVHKTFF